MLRQKIVALGKTSQKLLTSHHRGKYKQFLNSARCFSSPSPEYFDGEGDEASGEHANEDPIQDNTRNPAVKWVPPVPGRSSFAPSRKSRVQSPQMTPMERKKKTERSTSPSEITYTGNIEMPITSQLHLVKPGEPSPVGTWPVFRLMVSRVMCDVRSSISAILSHDLYDTMSG